jgi:hypothetical protein
MGEFGVFFGVFIGDFGIFQALFGLRFSGLAFLFIELWGSIVQKKRCWLVWLRAGRF